MRLLRLFAALAAICFSFVLCPQAVAQAQDTPRVNGPWFTDGTKNPYAYNYKGQCTWYAFGRCGEAGWVLDMGGTYGDGYTFYGNVRNYSSKDFTPAVGAIMVYPSTLGGSGGAGHVAYVTAVADNDHWTIAQYNWTPLAYSVASITRNPANSQQAKQGSGSYTNFLGFVHPPTSSTGSPAVAHWVSTPVANLWYRSDEHLVYHIDGDLPNTVNETIDGGGTGTYSTNDGFQALSYSTPGWHTFEVLANNAASLGINSTTGKWVGGWDPNPPSAALSGGATPGTWYRTATTVSFKCSDALSGIRQSHYAWDTGGTFSSWAAVDNGTVQLIPGKHHLIVESEDNAYTGTTALGNRWTNDLGEFWLDTSPPAITVAARVVSSANSVQVEFTISNPNASPFSGLTVDLAQFGASKASEGAWTPGDIPGAGSLKKTFTFPIGFGTNKSMLFSANYHFGTTKLRFRTRFPRS